MTNCSWGLNSSWNICERTGRVARSPPKLRSFHQSDESPLSNVGRVNHPHSFRFWGPENSTQNKLVIDTKNIWEWHYPTNTPVHQTTTNRFPTIRGYHTFRGFTQTLSRSAFSQVWGWRMKSLKPSSQISHAGTIPATLLWGRLSLMFPHLTDWATCTSSP